MNKSIYFSLAWLVFAGSAQAISISVPKGLIDIAVAKNGKHAGKQRNHQDPQPRQQNGKIESHFSAICSVQRIINPFGQFPANTFHLRHFFGTRGDQAA